MCLDDNARGYTLSLSLSHTHTGALQKQLDGRAIWLDFLKGVPHPELPSLKYSHSSANEVSSVSFPDAFPLCLCVSAAVTHACSAVARWTACSVYQGSSRWPGQLVSLLFYGIVSLIFSHYHFMGKVKDQTFLE